MYPHSILTLLSILYKDFLKALPSEELKRSFTSIYSQTIALQPLSEVIKGLTPERNLAVLKTALQNFEDEHHLGLYSPWVKVSLKFAEQLIKEAKTNQQCKTVPQTDVSKTSGNCKPVLNRTIPTSERTSSPSTSRVAEAVLGQPREGKTSMEPKMPSNSKREKIYRRLQTKVDRNETLFPQSYITCKDKSCTFCRSLFLNMSLSRCTHRSCGVYGWYPHVGKSLWQSLQKYHAPGAVFTPKHGPKNGELPSIIDAKVTTLQSETSMDSSTIVNSEPGSSVSRSSHYTPSIGSKRRRSSTPSSVRSHSVVSASHCALDWADEVGRAIKLQPSQ